MVLSHPNRCCLQPKPTKRNIIANPESLKTTQDTHVLTVRVGVPMGRVLIRSCSLSKYCLIQHICNTDWDAPPPRKRQETFISSKQNLHLPLLVGICGGNITTYISKFKYIYIYTHLEFVLVYQSSYSRN